MIDGRGVFLCLLDVLDHVFHEPWCDRGPRRAPFATIFRWVATRTGMIGGPAWTCVGLHTLQARMVRTTLGYRERYRSSGCRGP